MTSFKDAIKSSNHGVILCLHVVPGSSQTVFPAGYNQWRKCIEIKVCSNAKKNKANNDVIQIVAQFFQLSEKDVMLMSGQKSKEKTIALRNISVEMTCSLLEVSFHEL